METDSVELAVIIYKKPDGMVNEEFFARCKIISDVASALCMESYFMFSYAYVTKPTNFPVDGD